MQVDNPTWNKLGECDCGECPLNDLSVCMCTDWMEDHGNDCPTAETYREACDLADGQPRLPGL
jgi:hypothetical protein